MNVNDKTQMKLKEAMFYEVVDDKVKCTLCPHNCKLRNNQIGLCGVRMNKGNKLYSLNYGLISSIAIDPIEKKPLYDYMPGSKILSIGSIGCNFKCGFCQNCDISREFVLPVIEEGNVVDLEGKSTEYRINTQLSNYKQMTPQDIINTTLHYDQKSIAYTYNEPTVFYELVYETTLLAREIGLSNVLVTNGYINEEPFKLLAPFIDAMNIDVKTYDQGLYRSVCGGDLDSVLNTIRLAIDYNIHIELTCLIVPSLFKDKDLIRQFFKELYDVSGDVYLHLSRYFPRYLYEEKATDIGYMMQIKEIALLYYTHVHLGNV